MNLKFTIKVDNVNTWCAKSGYKIITPLEIILNKLSIKKSTELMNKIFPDPDDGYTRTEAKKAMSIKLLYNTEEERKDIEEKTLELYGCIDYMLINKLDRIDAKYCYKDCSTGIITEKIEHVHLYTLCYAFSMWKIVDRELIEDWVYNTIPNIKNLDYYNIKNTLTREIEKLWT
jgi:hypothetical protein